MGAFRLTPVGTRATFGLGLVASAARQSGHGGVLASGFYVQDGRLRSEPFGGSYRETTRRAALQGALLSELRVWRGLWVGAESRLGPARVEFDRSETVQLGDRTPRRTADEGARWQWVSDGRLRAVVRL